MIHICYYDSPIGVLRIFENGNGITMLKFVSNPKEQINTLEANTPLLKEAVRQLSEYFAGNRTEFKLPLDLQGTDFQLKTWNALRAIPYGETRTYKQIAEAIACPKGCRAVGLANNRNPVAIVVPCHRVIGANGNLVGYAGGLDKKEKLLMLETKPYFVE